MNTTETTTSTPEVATTVSQAEYDQMINELFTPRNAARSIFGADRLFRVANTKNWAGYEVRVVSFESHGWGTSASSAIVEAVKRNGKDITGGKTYGKTYRIRASKLFPSNL